MGKERNKTQKSLEIRVRGLVMKWEGVSTQNICGIPQEPFVYLCKKDKGVIVCKKGLMDNKRHISFKRKRHFVILRKYQNSTSPHKGKRGVL